MHFHFKQGCEIENTFFYSQAHFFDFIHLLDEPLTTDCFVNRNQVFKLAFALLNIFLFSFFIFIVFKTVFVFYFSFFKIRLIK